MPHAATDILRWVEAWLQRETGAPLDPGASFSALGLDSLGVTRMALDLGAWLGRALPPTLAWDHPTPAALAEALGGGHAEAGGAAVLVAPGEPIAIVGMACRFPGAASPAAFWEALLEGRDCTRPVPLGRWALWEAASPAGVEPVRRGGFLDEVDGFDPGAFGVSPREAADIDPQARLMLELSAEALADAGLDPRALRGSATGVFTGLVWRDYAELQASVGADVTPHTAVGHAGALAANRVSYAFGLEGPSLAVDTACSSALVAVHLACESLRRGESTLALAGGVHLMLSPRTASAVAALGALAPDGRCKTLDASADGYARGEGAGVVVLAPLSRAQVEGWPVYALVAGSAVNNDGASNGITAPNPAAQRRMLRDACARAGVDPARVDVVELHGTGTPLGDPIEAAALGAVLGRGRPPERPLRVGSVKTNIGHLEAAAGVAGLIKLALAIHHRRLPPSLHFVQPNPRVDLAALRLEVATRAQPWPLAGEVPVGGVSSFGFGGTNSHLVLRGLPRPPAPEAPPPEAAVLPGEAGVVFVFAGGGCPPPDVAGLLHEEPAFRATWRACERAWRGLTGGSLTEAALAPEGALVRRGRVQLPLTLAFQLSMAARWRHAGLRPAATLGYSVGEWAAACVAGAITLEEAFGLARAYVEVQAEVEDGLAGMAVVGLPPEEVARRLAGREQELALAAWNGPRSAGVGGRPEALAAFVAGLQAEGLFARVVEIDFFAHVPAAAPLADALARRIEGLRPRPTTLPFWSTVRGAVVPGERLDAAYWADNLRAPVRFGEAVAGLRAEGPRWFLDLNPHPIHAPALAENLPEGEAARWLLASARRGEAPARTLAEAEARLRSSGWRPPTEERPRLLVASAADAEALAARAQDLLAVEAPVARLAPALALRAPHHRLRRAAVARDREGLRAAWSRPPAPAERAEGTLAWVFSGQGASAPEAGLGLMARDRVFRDAFCEGAAAVADHGGPALLGLARAEVSPGERAAALARPEVLQPWMFVTQRALAARWAAWGLRPALVLGHSLGEVAAACVAGALDLDAAARVAVARGQAMATLPPTGGMLAVALDEARALEAASLAEGVELAACNGPEAHVLAGPAAALRAVERRLGDQGVRVASLGVPYAFHSAAVAPAARRLEAMLEGLPARPPATPLISTVTGARHEVFDAAYWAQNVRACVRFGPAVEAALAEGARRVIELGPHPALLPHLEAALARAGGGRAAGSLRRGQDDEAALLTALGALYVAGLDPDWEAVFPEGAAPLPLPPYPWRRRAFWFAHDATAPHPLLGGRPRREGEALRHEATLSRERPAFLAEHVAEGVSVVPGAAFLAAALDAAAREGDARPQELSGVAFQRALALEAPRRLRLVRGDEGAWQVESLPEGGGEALTHARLTVRASARPRPPLDPAPEGGEPLDAQAAYARLAATGLALGPRFRWVHRARVTPEGLALDLRAPGPAGEEGPLPTFLDALFHAATFLPALKGDRAAPLAALGVERLTWWGPAPAEARARLTLRHLDAEAGRARFDVLVDDGERVIAEGEGLRVGRVPLDRFLGREAPARRLGWSWAAVALPPRPPEGRWCLLTEDPAQAEGLARALGGAEVAASLPPGPFVGVVDLRPLADPSPGAALAAARAGIAAGAPPTWWLTRGAVAAGPGEAPDPRAAACWGLAHAAAREHPEAGFALIDLPPEGPPPWDAVARALALRGRRRLALRGEGALAPGLVPLDGPEPRAVRGAWLITGGAGALGLAVAGWLAARGASRLALMGRRPPGPAAREAIAAWRAAGLEVEVVQGDVADREDLDRALVAAGPGLRGVVHAAGVLDDGVLTRQDPARLAAVMRPKLDGALALEAATAGQDLDAFVLFGSVAGALGSPGQSTYAAANAALAALAGRRRARGLPGLCLSWGPWLGQGMSESAEEKASARRALGLGWLRPEAALAAFGDSLGAEAAEVLIVGEGELSLDPQAPPPPAAEGARGPQIEAAVREVLGLAPDAPLDPERPFQDLGMDSLLALQLRERLGAALGRALPATLLFEQPTLAALQAHLGGAPAPAARPTPVRAPGRAAAVVGMACRLPGGVTDPASYWRLLERGGHGCGEVPPDRWDVDAWWDPDPAAPGKMISRRGHFIEGVDRFDAPFFGIAPREARSMDPQQRLLLELTWEALEHAGLPPGGLRGRRVGVFVGLAVSDYGELELRAPDPRGINEYSGQGAVLSIAAGRISFALGLEGPAMVVDTACSSSLVAAQLALESLRRGECELAIVAGANLMLTPTMSVYFSKMGALSPDGRCKSFDARADGYGRGEGVGVVVLKPLEAARADGDPVRAVLLGAAVNQDGRSYGLTAPRGEAQVQVIREALADAGLSPEDVGYVEAHGTGTPLGDLIEARAIVTAYGGHARTLRLGSAKANLGHLETGAGVAGLIKAALMVERGAVPPQPDRVQPSAEVDWEAARVRLAREGSPWRDPRRVVGVSSFGFSGTNAHVLIANDPAPPAPLAPPAPGPVLLPLSARHPESLRALAERVAAALEADLALAPAARTAQHHRDHHPHRLAVVAQTARGAAAGLRSLAAGAAPEVAVQPGVGPEGERLAARARAWVDGEALDPAACLPREGPRAALPTYPWRALRYWTEPPEAPLCGEPLDAPLPGLHLAARWRATPLFDAHVLHGERVAAGALIACALLGGAGRAGLAGGLVGLAFARPLVVPARGERRVHLAITPEGEGRRVAVSAWTEGAWARCAEGSWDDALRPAPLPEALAEALAGGGEEADPGDVDDLIARAGLVVGPAFQHADTLRRGDGWVAGRLRADEPAPPGLPAHPGALDSVLRAMITFAGTHLDDGRARVVSSMGRVALAPGLTGPPARFAGRRRPQSTPELLRVDVWLLDEAGRVCLSAEDVTAVPFREAAPARWLERAWLPLPPPRSGPLPSEVFTIGQHPSTLAALSAAGLAARSVAPSDLDALPRGATALDLRALALADAGALAEALVGVAALARRPDLRALVLTRAGDPLSRAVEGAVAGLRREHPTLGCARLAGEGAAEALLAALAEAGGAEAALVLGEGAPGEGGRRGLRVRPASVGQGRPRLRGLWCVSGGTGALGRTLVEALVAGGVEAVALASRTPPDAEARAWMASLPVQVRHAALDVADRAAVEAWLDGVRAALGPVRGVLHAAGVLRDQLGVALDLDAVAEVLAPKVAGALNLHEATRADPVEHFVLMSSLSGWLGQTGQVAYGAANAFLDGLAARRRAEGLPALSLAWGPWGGPGMAADPALTAGLRRQGLRPLAPDEGARAFLEALGSPATCLGYADVDWRLWAAEGPEGDRDALLSALLPREAAAAPAAPPGPAPQAKLDPEALRRLPEAARVAALREALGAIFAEAAELDGPPDDPGAPLAAYGLDSFVALRFLRSLEGFGVELPLRLLLTGASLDELAAFVGEALSGAAHPPDDAPEEFSF